MKKISILMTGIACAIGEIFLMEREFNYIFYVPSMHRVIYIPILFWSFYIAYLFITYQLFLKGRMAAFAYIKASIIPAFFLHLYLAIGNLIDNLFVNQGELSNTYFLYIKAIFLLSTAAAGWVSVKSISSSDGDGMARLLIYPQFIVSISYFFFYNILSKHFNFAFGIGGSALVGMASNLVKIDGLRDTFRKFLSKDINIIAAIFILALIVRMTFGIALVSKTTHGQYGYDGYLYASDDGLTYDEVANKILQNPSILLKGEFRLWGNWDQLYSLFLALFYKLVGRNFYVLTCAQSFLGAFIPVFIFLIGRMLFSRIVGLIASILLSFKGGLILLSAYMGHEAVWLPILYLIALTLTMYFKEPASSNIFHAVITGFGLGILILFRSMYLYFLPFLCLWEILFFRKIKISKKLLQLSIIVLISTTIVLSVSYLFKNEIRLINRKKAMHLWQASRLEPPFQYLGNERLEAMGINFFQDPKASLASIAEHPIRFLVLAAKLYPLRIVAYLEAYQFGFFDPIYMVNPAKIKNKFASALEFYFTLFFLLGLFGSILKKETLNSPIFLILSFHIIFFCFVLFHPSPRLKEISSPLIYLVGSFGAHMAFKFLTKSNNC